MIIFIYYNMNIFIKVGLNIKPQESRAVKNFEIKYHSGCWSSQDSEVINFQSYKYCTVNMPCYFINRPLHLPSWSSWLEQIVPTCQCGQDDEKKQNNNECSETYSRLVIKRVTTLAVVRSAQFINILVKKLYFWSLIPNHNPMLPWEGIFCRNLTQLLTRPNY